MKINRGRSYTALLKKKEGINYYKKHLNKVKCKRRQAIKCSLLRYEQRVIEATYFRPDLTKIKKNISQH